jgi:hypothetical protein
MTRRKVRHQTREEDRQFRAAIRAHRGQPDSYVYRTRFTDGEWGQWDVGRFKGRRRNAPVRPEPELTQLDRIEAKLDRLLAIANDDQHEHNNQDHDEQSHERHDPIVPKIGEE